MRVLNKFNYFCKSGILADFRNRNVYYAAYIYAAASNKAALCLFNRQTFAGKHRFIGTALSLYYFAVKRYALAGLYNYRFADGYIFCGHCNFLAAAQYPRGIGRQAHKLFHSRGSSALAVLLKLLAERHKGYYHRYRLIIEIMHRMHIVGYHIGHNHAVNKRSARTYGYKRIHIRVAAQKQGNTVSEKSPADEHYGYAKQQLGKRKAVGVARYIHERGNGQLVCQHLPH